MLDTQNVIISEKPLENKHFSPLYTQIETVKEHTISTFDNINVIIEGENTSIIKVPNTLLSKLKSDMTMGEKIMHTKELMPRKETEKEINRLDKDILEIKSDIKEIQSDLKEIKREMSNFVTKDYLQNEFKPNIINEIKLIAEEQRKSNIKWYIGTTIAVISVIIAALQYFLPTQ